jgi:hypothetical protein
MSFLSKLISKTKAQKHREFLISEINAGHVLTIDGSKVNKKPVREVKVNEK